MCSTPQTSKATRAKTRAAFDVVAGDNACESACSGVRRHLRVRRPGRGRGGVHQSHGEGRAAFLERYVRRPEARG